MPIPPIIFLAAIICGSAVAITFMTLVARHIEQRRRASPVAPDDEIARRLEHIEQVVDATAIEVERIAESNRFVARLLADKTDAVKR